MTVEQAINILSQNGTPKEIDVYIGEEKLMRISLETIETKKGIGLTQQVRLSTA